MDVRLPRIWLRITLVLTLGLACKPAIALDPSKRLSQHVLDLWRADDGLPGTAIQAITRTRDGYVWIGTQNGLARFDGARFTVFDESNTPGLLHGYVLSLCEDRDGVLWIGTLGGLTAYSGGRFRTFTHEDGLPGNGKITCLSADPNGGIWAGVAGGGLARFSNTAFTSFTRDDGFIEKPPWAILNDSSGRTWIGTAADGLCAYSDGRFRTYTTRDGLSGNSITSLSEGPDGSIWIGTLSGATRFSSGSFTKLLSNDGLPDEEVNVILAGRDGAVWFGTVSKGLCRYSAGRFEIARHMPELGESSVLSLFEDEDGSVWAGASGTGLLRLSEAAFRSAGRPEGLDINGANAILEAATGSVWLAGSNGLFEIPNGSRPIRYTQRDGLPYDCTNVLCEGPDGSIWIGTYGGGLARYARGRFTSYTTASGLTDDVIGALCQARDGTLWIGTMGGGVCRLDAGRIRPVRIGDLGPDMSVHSIIEARDGTLWFGTQQGLVSLRGERTRLYTTADGLSISNVLCLHEDSAGEIWIGTLGGGLNRFAAGKFYTYGKRDGLPDHTVLAIQEDGMGGLWLFGNRALCSVSKADLQRLTLGGAGQASCRVFGKADGIRGECSGGSPAAVTTRRGMLAFATSEGYVTVDPTALAIDKEPLHMHMEEVLADGRPVSVGAAPSLMQGMGRLDFRFTAISPRAPQRVMFRCKLDGYDADWIDNGARRTLSYTNLPPGTYSFRAICCNEDGIWDPAGISFEFKIAPRFYQTYGFLTLIAVLIVFAAAAASLWRQRMRAMRERELRARVCAALGGLHLPAGPLPICACCKSAATEDGGWTGIDEYLRASVGIDIAYRVCPSCIRAIYPDLMRAPAPDTSSLPQVT